MRKPRDLSASERALWDQVAGRTTPLETKRTETVARLSCDKHPPPQKQFPQRDPIPHFQVGAHAQNTLQHDLLPAIGQRLKTAPVNMDAKSYHKMARGKIRPEARIDLHGMTTAQAHPALVGFILNAHTEGKRLVLVITGKGKDRDDGGPIPVRHGVLRHQVPQWMALAPLKPMILQITPAHIRHGGQGAYYVYLRRSR